MLSGEALTLWFLGSAIACLLLMLWVALSALNAEGHRALAMGLIGLTAILVSLPSGLSRVGPAVGLTWGTSVLAAIALLLAAVFVVLLRLRKAPELRDKATFALAAVLNLWVVILVLVVPVWGG